MKRRTVLAGVPALVTAGSAWAGLFDPDVMDVEFGSSTTSVLDPKTSRRLAVQTKLRTRDIKWIDANGRVQFVSSQTLVDNKYNWQETAQRSTDIWRVTAEDQKETTWAVLRVRSTQNVPLFVSLFPGATSARSLDPELGIDVAPSEDAANEWLALFQFDPRANTFITVQAKESERVPYRVAVLPASRFRR